MSRNVYIHHFEIGGMTCDSCSETIRNILIAERFVKEVEIDRLFGQARVIVDTNINPQNIVESIKELGFKARYIPTHNEKSFYFSLKGLLRKDVGKICEKLERKKAYIKSFDVNYATSVVTINACVERARLSAFIKEIKKDITDSVPRPIIIKEIQPPMANHEDTHTHKYYFSKALMNAMLGLPLILFSAFIPLPITLVGQFIGLFIGGVTLGVMWETGKEFYRNAWQEFKNRRPANMNTLIALGTGSAWIYSMLLVLAPMFFAVATFQYQFLAVVMILGIINLGKALRARAQEQTKRKIQSLAEVYVKLQPQIANRLKLPLTPNVFKRKDLNQHFELVNYLDVKEEEIVKVDLFQRIPVDGIIVHGSTRVNQKTLTGESEDCDKIEGDEVFAGSLNKKFPIFVKATHAGPDGQLTRLIEGVARARSEKISISKQVDKIANYFVPTIIIIALLTALGWFLLGPAPALVWMISSAMSVLLCACPCALGLATPISIAISMYKLFQMGILVHRGNALEAAAELDTIVFDKTGTLTKPGPYNAYFAQEVTKEQKNEILQAVASFEQAYLQQHGEHPIAAVLAGCHETGGLPCSEIRKDDQGISGSVAGKSIFIGNISYLLQNNIHLPQRFREEEANNTRNGISSICIAIEGQFAIIGLKHTLRPDAKKAIEDLRRMNANIDIFMLTGDTAAAALPIARQLGINEANVFAGKNAREKREKIIWLKSRGRKVGMIGDGLNDTEANDVADVAFALGPLTHAAASCHIALQKLNVASTIVVARETVFNIRQNLWWTLFYNLISLVAATGLLYPLFGFVLNPVVASMAMALSSLFVVLNSSRLFYRIDDEVNIYEGRQPRPTTFFDKVKHALPFKSLYQTILMLTGLNEQEPVLPAIPRADLSETFTAVEEIMRAPSISFPSGVPPIYTPGKRPSVMFSPTRGSTQRNPIDIKQESPIKVTHRRLFPD